MAKTPSIEPMSGMVAIRSLEDEDEDAEGPPEQGDPCEMAKVIAVRPGSQFAVGEVVFVRPFAFHMADRIDDDILLVSEYEIVARATSDE